MPTQKRNPENVDLLSADFAMRNEPNVAWGNVISALVNLPGVRAVWPMSGNLFAIGDPFGSMYIPGVDIVVVIGAATPFEVKNAAADGWAAGELNRVTFPTGGDEHYLTVPESGKYRIIWSISGHTGAGGATSMHGGVMKNGVAIRNNGEAHRDVGNFNDDGNIASVCVTDCPLGTEQISLWVSVGNSQDFHAEHSTMDIEKMRGT